MSIVFLLVAFAGVLLATFRSLGWGFLAVLAVGYFNGVVRANFLSVYTTFMFDAAVLGLYLGFFIGQSRRAAGVWSGPAGPFVRFLIAWPTLLSFVPVNNFLVQLVALRGNVWLRRRSGYSDSGRIPGTRWHWPWPLAGRAYSDNVLLVARRP